MKNGKVKWLVAGIAAALAIAIFLYGQDGITGNAVLPGQHDDFAKYLSEQGVKMYGTEWCSHCKNQKELFGASFQYVNYIDCDKKREECSSAGVQGYPTWRINGQNYPGEQPLERLAQLSGYAGNI